MTERRTSWSGSEHSAPFSSPLSSPSLSTNNTPTPQPAAMSTPLSMELQPLSFEGLDTSDVHTVLASQFAPSSGVDGDDDGDSDERSSVAGGVTVKRDIHTINEQRRRDIIKQAYSTLERIVPTCKPNPGSTRLSRATILLKTADYVGYLEDHHRKQTSKLEGMRKEVKALEIMKENYEQIVRAQGQQVLGGSGAMATSQLPGDINFKLFEAIMDHLFQSFNARVSTENFDTLSSCVISWLEEFCTPQNLHEVVMKELQAGEYSSREREMVGSWSVDPPSEGDGTPHIQSDAIGQASCREMDEYEKPTAPLLPNPPPAHNPHYQPAPQGYPDQYQTAPQGYPDQYQPAPQGYPDQYQPTPPAYTQQPTPGYYGAAPSGSATTTTTNVIVVNQPTRPPTVAAPLPPRAPEYLGFSVCTLVFCLVCGGLPFILCAVIALVFSLKAQDQNKAGDYMAARSSGRVALGFNIAAFVSGPLTYVGVVIGLIVYATGLNASTAYPYSP